MTSKSKKNKQEQNAEQSAGGVTATVSDSSLSVEKRKKISGKDIFLWSLSVLLLIVAVGGNYYLNRQYESFFSENQLYQLFKAFGVIFIIVLSVVIVGFTATGRHVISFTRESYIEVRRVVWPTGQEARATTVYIGVVTVVVALMLWLFDMVFMTLISLFNKI